MLDSTDMCQGKMNNSDSEGGVAGMRQSSFYDSKESNDTINLLQSHTLSACPDSMPGSPSKKTQSVCFRGLSSGHSGVLNISSAIKQACVCRNRLGFLKRRYNCFKSSYSSIDKGPLSIPEQTSDIQLNGKDFSPHSSFGSRHCLNSIRMRVISSLKVKMTIAIVIFISIGLLICGLFYLKLVPSNPMHSFSHQLIELGRDGTVQRHPYTTGSLAFITLFFVLLAGIPVTPLEITYGYLFGWTALLVSLPSKVLGSIAFYRLATLPCYDGILRKSLEKYTTFKIIASVIHESPLKYSLMVRCITLPMVVKNYSLILLKVPFHTYVSSLVITAIPYSVLSCSMGLMASGLADGLASHLVPMKSDNTSSDAHKGVDGEPLSLLNTEQSYMMTILQAIAIMMTVLLPITLAKAYLRKHQQMLVALPHHNDVIETNCMPVVDSVS